MVRYKPHIKIRRSTLTISREPKGSKVAFPSQDPPSRAQPLKPSKLLNTHVSADQDHNDQPTKATSSRTARTSIKRQFNSNHLRLSTPTSARPRLQSAGSIPSELGLGSGSTAPRSTKKWARSAHLHEVRVDAARSAAKSKKGDSVGKSRALKENDVFGSPGEVARSPYEPVSAQVSPMVTGEIADSPSTFIRRAIVNRMEEGGEGDGWVDTDVDNSDADADVFGPPDHHWILSRGGHVETLRNGPKSQ
jgi:hypothetical protein